MNSNQKPFFIQIFIIWMIAFLLIACESDEQNTKKQANLYLDAQMSTQIDQFLAIDVSISDQALSISDQALSISDQALSISDQALSISDQALNISDQALSISDQALNISDQTIDTPPQTCEILFQVTFPASTPQNDPIMITGDLFNPPWQEAPEAGLMQRNGSSAELQISLPQGKNIEFKFTRGRWELIEKASNCQELPNRTLFVRCLDRSPVIVASQVINWRNFDGCLQ
jgi:hypothetical protein